LHVLAAIDRDMGAGHERRPVRAQVDDKTCNFFGLAEASERDLRQDLSWDSPDDFRTGANIIAFPSSLEDRREVRTATGTLGQPERWSSGRSGHFPWHWHGSIRRARPARGLLQTRSQAEFRPIFTDLSDDRGVRIGKLEFVHCRRRAFHEQSAGKLRASAAESCLAVGGSPAVTDGARVRPRCVTLAAGRQNPHALPPLSVSTAKAAAASITCSQLSSTSSIFRLMPRS
jgi:hypothetical protein